MQIPFLDLKAQLAPIRGEVDAAIKQVLDNTAFILGPGVADFEADFAEQTGRKHAVGLNSGTSALHLALIAAGVGPGDEVITTPHTWISTTWAISYVGATPVYADIDPATANLDPAAAEAAITERTKAILPVDLYGHPAALTELEKIAESHGIALIEDAAQSHLATLDGRPAGSFGQSACFSFYPGKNLGAAGEGGAVVTDDDAVADRVRRLRDHAQDGRHNHVEVGYNYRMEGLQGAVLSVKLRHLAEWTEGRRAAATRYAELIDVPGVTLPQVAEGAEHAWHIYAIRVAERDAVGARLKEAGVATGVHYPKPVHLQPAYEHLGYERGQFPHAEEYADTCLSLPMFAELTADQQAYVAEKREGRPGMSDRTPLVIGGAGFIGSALVRHLAESGPVRVLDDLSTGSAANLEGVAGVDFIEADLLDEDALTRAITDTGIVYHLACLGVRHSIHQPFRNHQVNAEGTLRILETSRRLGVDRVVYCSTSEVYGTAERVPMDENHPTWPHTVYGGSKLAGEAYTRAYHVTYGMPTVVLRPFNAFGPRSHHEGDSGEVIPKFVVRAKNGLPPIVFGDGEQTRDFTFVEDSARGIAAAGVADRAVGATVNIGSGHEITVNELARLVGEVTGTGLSPEYHPGRPGDVLRLFSDSTRAADLLGWKPQVSLREGLEKLVAWHDEQGTDWSRALTEDVQHNWEVDA